MNEADFIGEHSKEVDPVDPQVEQVEEQEDAPKLSAIEQKAYDQGWRPQEDFEGPEENWKTAKEYVKDGEWISKVNELNRKMDAQKAEFNERLENTNKLNEARRKSEIEELKQRQRQAVDEADSDAYDRAQNKIDNLEKQADVTPVTPGKDPDIAAWEEKNSWINNSSDEKTTIANSIFSNYTNQNPNATAKQALDHLDSRLKDLYPLASNPRREQPDTTENPQRKPKAKNRSLSMDDLTQAEQNEWSMFGKTMFKTQDAFLKAVTDARKK